MSVDTSQEAASDLSLPPIVAANLAKSQCDAPSEGPDASTAPRAVEGSGSLEDDRKEPLVSSPPPLPSPWLSASKSRREIPQAAKVGGAGVALLLLFVFVMPQTCSSSSTVRTSTMIADNAVEGGQFLKKRRHLTDQDFGGTGVPMVARAPDRSTEVASASLKERQRLREQNPEDLRSAQERRRRRRRKRSGARREEIHAVLPSGEEDMISFFHKETESTAYSRSSSSEREVLLPAASIVRVSLTRDIVIRGGRATVVAVVGKGERLPSGTTLLGRASAGRDGLVSISFRSVVLPDGQSVSTRAQAVDRATGSEALVGGVTGGRRESGRSAAGSVVASAAERALGMLGGSFLGETARDGLSEAERRRGAATSTPVVVTLSRDTKLEALFLREVVLERR